MAFETPKISYSGAIREVQLGSGDNAVMLGGETSYPFHTFEGEMPHAPKIAMEVYDAPPEDWAPAALEPFADVVGDPAAWAAKCVNEFGAEIVCLQLASIDPNGEDRPAAAAVEVVKNVAAAVDVPLIVMGCANDDKDAEVLRQVAEACEGRPLVLGPVTEENYKQIGAAAIAYKHTVAASSPIDINLCKQLNILLADLGVPDAQIVVDPTTGGLGYGLEYTYSVMERLRMAGLTQRDERLQFPIVCNMAKEVWKVKEVKTPESEDPKLGDATKRGVMMEAVTAMSLMLAGADVLVMRHPQAIAQIRAAIKDLAA
jgi:acetyl-CoA decarbonylase/synthase, CODH/ACS complex subunit delta